MILGFRHRGLKRLFENDEDRYVLSHHKERTRHILAHLDEANQPQDMNLPGYRMHPLAGNIAGFWAVRVSKNWRIIFRFEGRNAVDVDRIDYHKED